MWLGLVWAQGHSNLGITSVDLQGIDNAEIIETVHARCAPMIPVSASAKQALVRRTGAGSGVVASNP